MFVRSPSNRDNLSMCTYVKCTSVRFGTHSRCILDWQAKHVSRRAEAMHDGKLPVQLDTVKNRLTFTHIGSLIFLIAYKHAPQFVRSLANYLTFIGVDYKKYKNLSSV